MLKRWINSYRNNRSVRLSLLAILVLTAFGYSGGRYFFVRAYDSSVNLLPGNFSVTQLDYGPRWEGPDQSFYQDLDPDAAFEEFDRSNSAWLVWNAIATTTEAAASGTPMVAGEDNIGEAAVTDPSLAPASTGETVPGEADDSSVGAGNDPSGQPSADPAGATAPNGESGSETAPAPAENISTPVPEEVPSAGLRSRLSDSLAFFYRDAAVPLAARAQAEPVLRQSLIYDDFSVPMGSAGDLGSVKLSLSLAGRSGHPGDRILIESAIADEFVLVGSLDLDSEISNRSAGGYVQLAIPDIKDWASITGLKIRLSYISDSQAPEEAVAIYLDALWLTAAYSSGETAYEPVASTTDEVPVEAESPAVPEAAVEAPVFADRGDFYLDNLTTQTSFEGGEEPKFKLRYRPKQNLFERVLSTLIGAFYDELGDLAISARVLPLGDQAEAVPAIVRYLGRGELEVEIPATGRDFRPGRHTIELTIKNGEETMVGYQDFTWGVLAFNVNKSRSRPGEEADLQFGVLDDLGNTLCSVEFLTAEITDPMGRVSYLSTYNGGIEANPDCGPNNVIDRPDWYGHYRVSEPGEYRVRVSAGTKNGQREISDRFLVEEAPAPEIERTGPTRIYPKAPYRMRLKVRADRDYRGEFTDYVPSSFSVQPHQGGAVRNGERGTTEIVWAVDWTAGETYIYSYEFDAPDVFPEFYLLGPAVTDYGAEYRQWQVASDAATFRVNEYYLTTGQFTGTTYSLTLNQNLAEDYFIFVRGSREGDGGTNPDNDYARITAVPGGRGDLPDSGAANRISLSRYVNAYTWEGVVTVVECLGDRDGSGFRLVDVAATDLAQSATSGTDQIRGEWGDLNRVVPFGAYHGGGAEFKAAATSTYEGDAVYARLYPTGTSTINWRRVKNLSLHTMKAATITTFVVEWGNEWTVQRAYVSGTAAGDGTNAVTEYTTAAINSVTRANTWVWGTGVSVGEGIGDDAEGTVITLGNGVNTFTTATTVAMGAEFSFQRDFDIYTMSHPRLAADHRFKVDGNAALTDIYVPVNPVAASGTAMALSYNGCNGSGGAHPRDRFWYRYVSSSTIALSRGYSGQTFPAWYQGIDFAGVSYSFYGSADEQYKSNGVTVIPNQSWTDESAVKLGGFAYDATTTDMTFYFEVLSATSSFTTATTAPAGYCNSGTAFDACSVKTWRAATTTRSGVIDPVNWYDARWRYRKSIQIKRNLVMDNLTAFPVLATMTDAQVASNSHPLGYDIIFTASDGTTRLPHEREYYSSSTGALAAWFTTNLATTSTTTVYMYYGYANTGTDHNSSGGVWDANFQMVQHMEEATGSGYFIQDSTTNANHGWTGSSGPTRIANAPADGAWDFSGTNRQRVEFPDSTSLQQTTGMTAEVWANVDASTAPDHNPLLWKGSQIGWGAIYQYRIANSSGAMTWGVTCGATEGYFGGGNAVMDSWAHYAITYDGTTARAYINGVQVGTTALCSGPLNVMSGYPVRSGFGFRDTATTETHLDGSVDEIRISNVARSAGWLQTEFNSVRSVNNFLVMGGLETPTTTTFAERVSVTSLPDSATGYKWQVLACKPGGICAAWDEYDPLVPNFRVDATPPTMPGDLSIATVTPTTITLAFGSSTNEMNFYRYRIFYKVGTAEVSESNTEHGDNDLNYLDYGGTGTTTIENLKAATSYVLNIWAYDLAGNKVSAHEITIDTTEAPHARGQSVYFPAGYYSGNGTIGQNTNTAYAFSPFNLSLGEHEVDVRNAYIMIEANISAYSPSTTTKSNALYFDACLEPCTANALTGTTSLTTTDATVLAYSETETDNVRLLFDVTSEPDLFVYNGDSKTIEAQVGYRFDTDYALNSIANVQATLVLTYAYNVDDSTSYTNTVFYPLESNQLGDQGTRSAIQGDDCTLDSNCPILTYTFTAPEASIRLADWYRMYLLNDNGGANDVSFNVNLSGTNIDSNTYIHEAALDNGQSGIQGILFPSVTGFSFGSLKSLEVHPYSLLGGPTYYLLGGETAATYLASTSAATKTRTVRFPLGVINAVASIGENSATATVNFPENGSGSGNVSIKKAWFRLISNNIVSGVNSMTVASKVETNSKSTGVAYSYNPSATIANPDFTVIHVIPAADYSMLASANASSAKAVSVYVQNLTANQGGVSGELAITYTYTDETSGYLTSLNVYAGQSVTSGSVLNASSSAFRLAFPEKRGSKSVRSAALVATNHMSDSDLVMPAGWYSADANLSTGTPVCTNSYQAASNAYNLQSEFYRSVVTQIDAIDKNTYTTCWSNDGDGDTNTSGAKSNSYLAYTYQWDAPQPIFTENDWRWYANADSVTPTIPLAGQNTSIGGINLGETIRLRINIGVTYENAATNTQSFKLQFAKATNCAAASVWTDLGGLADPTAWRGYNNPAPLDADNLTTALLASSTVYETYEETSPSLANPRAIPKGGNGEWDWVVYDNNASATSEYCFRMARTDGSALNDYLSDSYPKLTTAAANTAPDNPSNLGQFRSGGTTVIANQAWLNDATILLKAGVTDPNLTEVIRLFYEFIPNASSSLTATSVPAGACAAGTTYGGCASKVWYVSSASGDWRTATYYGTSTITGLPNAYDGYKWQVLACDDDNDCSAWIKPGTAPNVKVDLTYPTAPGALTIASTTATSITLRYGASSTEANFSRYRIYYRLGATAPAETDSEHADGSLLYQSYNSRSTTTVLSLSAGTLYSFNIWAYDLAGNKASSTAVSTTTINSFTPPTGEIYSAVQKTNGSGAVDVVFWADDADNDDNLRARLDYEAGSACSFGAPLDPYLDTVDANTTATYGDPKVDNGSVYQVGTTSGWIWTSPGQNFISADWLSKINIPAADGTYCLRLTVNDGLFSQSVSDVQMVYIDNIAPTRPGSLTLAGKRSNSARLTFGGQSTDARFSRYRIFYKIGTTSVTELDGEHADGNLLSESYSNATSTLLAGLTSGTQYVVNIWGYDTLGNNASATTEVAFTTNYRPLNLLATGQYKANGTTAIPNGDWTDENTAWFNTSVHDQDTADLVTFYFEAIAATGTFRTATSVPESACVSGTSFGACTSKVWAVSTSTANLPANWYNSNWPYRKKITINSSAVAETTNGFAVMATTTDANLAAAARSDGRDIIFTAANGTTTVNFERASWNKTTGQLTVWLKADVSTSANTELYMYYGNPAATTEMSTTTGVWGADVRGIWHLDEDVVDEGSQSDAHQDASGQGNHLDQYGNNETASFSGKGQDFDGNDQAVAPSAASLNLSNSVTLAGWVKVTNAGAKYERLISFSTSTDQAGYQVKVELGTGNFTYNRVKTGGDDIRFYSTAQQSLPYWIETWNPTGTSTIWVNVAATGTRSMIMQYGDSTLSAASSLDNTMDTGLRVQYYDGTAFNTYLGNCLDTTPSYGWGNGVVAIAGCPNTQSDTASLRWTGWVINNGSGSHSFTTTHDDGIRLYMPSPTLLINHWVDTGDHTESATYSMSAPAPVTMEFYENTGGATARLGWTPPASGLTTPIPAAFLRSRKYSTIGATSTLGSEEAAGIVKTGSYGLVVDAGSATALLNSTAASTTVNSGWNHLAMVYDRFGASPQLKLYVNGELRASTTLAVAIASTSADLVFADRLTAQLDELYLASTTRTAGWLANAYNNQKAVNAFLAFGAVEQVTSISDRVSVAGLPDSGTGYKWQALACDDDGDCTDAWTKYNITTPNLRVDTLAPTPPGSLSDSGKTSASITLNYGGPTTEANFSMYRIYYSTSSPVTEANTEHDDSDLDDINYASQTNTTVGNLLPNTTYYFNIWAYDVVGRKASATPLAVTTDPVVSSPGAAFYARSTASGVLYYRIWNGTSWGPEKTGPTFGVSAGSYIRQVRALRSDNGNKIALLVKTWNGTDQEWWGSVYRFAADDFVNTTQLGSAWTSATNDEEITGCLGSLSSGEFFIVKNNHGGNGTLVYSWSAADGWVTEAAGPDNGGVMNACELHRRPGTDNYLLMMYDDGPNVNTSYYYGGSTYANNWGLVTEHATAGDNANNSQVAAFFDPADNTRGAIEYANSATNWYTQAKYFQAGASTLNFGAATTSPTVWTDDFIDGEFSANPAGGHAYFAGRDIDYRLSVMKLDVSSGQPVWSTTTNSTDIAGTNLYQETNYSQKPYALMFYQANKAVVAYSDRVNQRPYYRIINNSNATVSATSTVMPGPDANIWTRLRFYDDPSENELLAVVQNDDIDYGAVFWDGANESFYSAGNQSWTELATTTGVIDADNENVTYAFGSYNSPPNAVTELAQRKFDASTTIANGAWTNETSVNFRIKASDADTSEVLVVYLQVVANADSLATSTGIPAGACATTTSFADCTTKIWTLGTSTVGDYSVTPLNANATITVFSESASGYKWQAKSCDDSGECSSWQAFNASTPNFRTDMTAPTPPGALTVLSRTSTGVTLSFGATTTETNFSRYRIFYRIGAGAVAVTDSEQADNDLNYINYNSTANTVVVGLASSTIYSFNIWAYDLAGNLASATPQVSTTTAAAANLRQVSYLWENDDGTTVNANSGAAAIVATATDVLIGERFNLRIQLENTGGDSAAAKTYKVQFDTNGNNIWTDIGPAAAMDRSYGLSGANGDILSTAKAGANANTFTFGRWYENTGQTGAYTLNQGQYTEFGFAIETSNAATATTYRFRLYNTTDSQPLDVYAAYPALVSSTTDRIRYSKGTAVGLPSGTADLTYYLDPRGYGDVLTNDNSTRDALTAVSAIPIYEFAVWNSSNTQSLSATWNGSSSVAAATRAVSLQVYRFGATNAWQTVATNNTAAANVEFTLSAQINAYNSEYYSNGWTYWRVYQDSGSEILSTDYFNLTFYAPTVDARQLHYRWRNDNGTEATATWRENEDTGDPTTASPLQKGSSTRLRFEVANVGAGGLNNYIFRIEYATTTYGCSVERGAFTALPITATTQHFEMVLSPNYPNTGSALARLANSEGYTFATGTMIEEPWSTTTPITLAERNYAEMEYVFMPTTNAITAGSYCFRVSNNGTDLNGYTRYAELTLAGNTNTAPVFQADGPSDGGSATTSPTNEGENAIFTGTAVDAQSDEYYLAICQTPGVTAGVNAAPSCTGGSWCVSTAASSSVEATCNYQAATTTEVAVWYGYVCDKKPGIGVAKCSAASQGTGTAANNSPMHVNHRPSYTSVTSLNSPQDPGGGFVLSTASADADIIGGADTLYLYICRTNSASFSGCTGGVADTVCATTATSSPNAKCTYADVAPTPSGAYTYYAFVYDSHGLGSNPASRSANYTVNNVLPTLGTLVLNGGSKITLNIHPTDTTVQTINTSVTDQNGCQSGLVSATAAIYYSNVAGGYGCTANSNDCYQIGTANCVKSACTDDTDAIATYSCSAVLKYYALPTDDSAGNPYEPYNWLSRLQVYDGANYISTTSAGVDLNTSQALEVVETMISFGSGLSPGDNTGTRNSTSTVLNAGNSPIDSNINGSNMSGIPSGNITVNNIEYSLNNFNWSAGYDLTTSDSLVDIVAPRATSTNNVSDQIFWGIGIPLGTSPATYFGNNTFTAIIDPDNWE